MCIFRKRTPQEIFRKKVRRHLRRYARSIIGEYSGDSLFGGLMFQAKLTAFSKTLPNQSSSLWRLYYDSLFEWEAEAIIKEELLDVLKKYMEL